MKDNNFDFLRFLLAFIVVCGHLIIISGVSEFQSYAILFNSYTSVTGFFIISGFLIAASYDRTQNLKKYFGKRAARLLPAYIFVILSCAVLLSLISVLNFNKYFSNPEFFKYLLSNLFFLNFLQPCLPGVFSGLDSCAVNGALWTLKVEVSFYLILPLLIFFIRKFRTKWLIFILIYSLSVIYKLSLEHLSDITHIDSYSFLARQLPGFMSYFICGIAFYYYNDYFLKKINLFFLAGLLIFIAERIVGWEVFTPLGLSLIIFSIAFSMKGLNHFAKYGDISYGIYIFHFPVIKTMKDSGLFDQYNPYVVALLTIILIVIISFISWHLLEKPFLMKVKSERLKP